MKKILTLILAVLTFFGISSCANSGKDKDGEKTNEKIMVAYFSASPAKNTKAVAERIAKATGGVLREIEPATPYTEADLDWRDENSRSSKENDPACRPEIKDAKANLDGVEVVYLGYPNWWGIQPRIINTFIDANREALKDKVIIPFSTSGGSGIEESIDTLRANYPDLDFRNARLLNDASDDVINSWISTNPGTTASK